MTPDRWDKISEIYANALEITPGERPDYIATVCGDDEEVRREVESLLIADMNAGNFIAEPIMREVAPILAGNGPANLIGNTIRQYRIDALIGKGGMGEVFLATDLTLQRQVAIKMLPEELAADETYIERFRTEAKAAATLNHPNAATIYSVEEWEGRPMITMEYVEGRTLDRFIEEKPLEIGTFLKWFVRISDALSLAHEKSVIHRDIKPTNIIITRAGFPKILDFGLAQMGRGDQSGDASTLKITQPGRVIGTPSYMSPEQAEGKSVDHRSDIFSLGVVMYEAITGARPFRGDNYAAVVGELMRRKPPSISESRPDMPFLLSRLVERCLQKERRDRFQSMREVRVILEELQAAVDAGVSLNSESIPASRRSRGRVFKWTLAVLFGLVSVSAAYYLTRPPTPAPIGFENMTLQKLSQTKNVVYAHVSPDGRTVAYNTIDENDDRSLWIRRIEDKNSLLLISGSPIWFWGGLAFSRDGSTIFYVTAERGARHGTLYRISAIGGKPRKLVETVNDLGSVSSDGSRVLLVRFGDNTQIIAVNSADGGDERVVYSSNLKYSIRDPQYSPDDRNIYFVRYEVINGEEFWSVIEIRGDGSGERVIWPRRKQRISEIAPLRDGSGLLVNAVDDISNRSQIFYVALVNGDRTRITNDLNAYFGISISDDGSTVVTAQRFSAKDIWVQQGPGFQTAEKVTSEANVNTTAEWTPDGRIVFDAVDNNRPHIWIIGADGSGLQQLTPNDSTDSEPRVSPDGKFIIFTSERTGERKIWRMNIDGSDPKLLTPVSGAAFGAVFAPDGKNVIFKWNRDDKRVLGVVPITGGEITERRLPGEGTFAISPDGSMIAYVVANDEKEDWKVGVRPVSAAEPTRMFDFSPTNVFMWATDEKSLLYRQVEQTGESSSTVWRQPITGGEPTVFLSTKPDAVFGLSLSADRKRAAVIRSQLLTDAVMLKKIN